MGVQGGPRTIDERAASALVTAVRVTEPVRSLGRHTPLSKHSPSTPRRDPTMMFASRTTSAIVERVDVVHRIAPELHHTECPAEMRRRDGLQFRVSICSGACHRDDLLALFHRKFRKLFCERLERFWKRLCRGRTLRSHVEQDSASSRRVLLAEIAPVFWQRAREDSNFRLSVP